MTDQTNPPAPNDLDNLQAARLAALKGAASAVADRAMFSVKSDKNLYEVLDITEYIISGTTYSDRRADEEAEVVRARVQAERDDLPFPFPGAGFVRISADDLENQVPEVITRLIASLTGEVPDENLCQNENCPVCGPTLKRKRAEAEAEPDFDDEGLKMDGDGKGVPERCSCTHEEGDDALCQVHNPDQPDAERRSSGQDDEPPF